MTDPKSDTPSLSGRVLRAIRSAKANTPRSTFEALSRQMEQEGFVAVPIPLKEATMKPPTFMRADDIYLMLTRDKKTL